MTQPNTTIDSDIPIGPMFRKHPYKLLEVGQSFFVPGGNVKGISSGAVRVARETGAKFKCRTRVENNVAGVRVYRVA